MTWEWHHQHQPPRLSSLGSSALNYAEDTSAWEKIPPPVCLQISKCESGKGRQGSLAGSFQTEHAQYIQGHFIHARPKAKK